MIGGAKGIGIGIDFGIPNQYCRATSKPYIEKDVLDSLRVVASAYGKSNDDADRSIVKNLVDASNPFIISNAAFKLNSGFGKYETELSDTRIWTRSKDVTSSPFSSSYNGLSGWIIFANTELTNSVDIPSIKIEVKGLLEGQELIYRYYDSTGQTNVYSMTKDGEYTLPADVRTAKTLTSNTSGFQIVKNETNTNTITITQIPSFEGAFVTDGIDDLITSTKTVQEMLGGSNEITVVSMIHQIDGNVNYTNGYTNYIRHGGGFIRNSVTGINGKGFNKTGIYGYTSTQLDSSNMGLGNVINNILGDKDDYSFERSSTYTLDDAKYSVQNFVNANNQPSNEGSSVAWYWTIIANKVLTSDQINQVIAYFNLDRTLKPDILCNTIKQGITNENHAEFGDKLIDFSGNGRDIQLNNLAWDGDSGIGKYNYPNWKVTATIANTYSTIVNYPTVNGTYSINVNGVSELMQSIGLHLEIKYTTSTGIIYKDIKQDGVYSYILPDGATDLTLRFGGIPGIVNEPCNITITQIPSHAGALCLDGVNDFGKVTGMPIYKDYTVVADYIRTSAKENAQDSPILSKSQVVNNGAFVFNYLNINSVLNSYSFGINNGLESISDSERKIYYQSKYVNDGKSINSGTGIDYNSMWLGTYRDNVQIFFNGAIYSLMSFPYSMSKFLIERQLKKYKLGTLYPNMVEFRPIVKSNSEYQVVDCYIDTLPAVVGNYYPINSKLRIAVTTKGAADEVTSLTVNGVSLGTPSVNGNRFTFNGTLSDKSPQKINITIDEYIRYEDIVQPYPVLLRFNDENGNEVSWGGKFRVGSTITRIGSAADSNLLPNIYNIFGLLLNDNQVTSSKVIVEKTMVFKVKGAYIFDNNEPNCILSPRLLRIPNSSYKILGYIPDISGHGNHGVIHNSAYAGMSGANGYVENFTKWTVSKPPVIVSTNEERIKISYIGTSYKTLPIFEYSGSVNENYSLTVEIQGIPDNVIGKFIHNNGFVQEVTNGINTIKFSNSGSWYGFTFYREDNTIIGNCDITIKQIGEYEGAFCFDGVDDFVTIPTLSSGGKQVLMKVNWHLNSNNSGIVYDQRITSGSLPQNMIISLSSDTGSIEERLAYMNEGRADVTYIDGVLNKNITVSQLQGITHNITQCNSEVTSQNSHSPVLGMIAVNPTLFNYCAKMALYDFMLFDNISTDDKIKELNEYVGIEAKVELPPYYWDAYGKTNLDEDKATIQQRGTAVGDYDITNYNHAYDKMSGYGGYAFAKFDNTSEWIYTNNSDTIEVVNRDGYDVVLRKVGNGTNYWHFRNTIIKSLGQDIQIGVYANKSVQIVWQLKYKLEGETDYNTLAIASPTIEGNINTYVTLPYKTEQEIADLNAVDTYYSIYFIPIDLDINEEVTIEMLPLYDGLVYDGVDDNSENTAIPQFTDFSYIFKRKLLNELVGSASMNKGLSDQQRAIVVDYINANGNIEGTSFGNVIPVNSLRDSDIIYGTTNTVNGTNVTKGSNPDSNGINIGKFANWYKQMVFYKLILYPKTIPLLQINFLKNLMERDEIIDLNNPIFIQ